MKIKELFDIKKGKKVEEAQVTGGVNVLRYIQIEDLRHNNNMKFGIFNEKSVVAEESDIIIAWDGANAGTVGYGLSGLVGSTLAVLKPKINNIFTPYVGRFLQMKSRYLRDNCTGATIPHIQRASLENLEILLPPLEEQKRIANVLDKAQLLIKKRKEAIIKLDRLVQSVFLSMFGDPVKNNRGWTVREIGNIVVDIISGWSVGGEERTKKEDEIGVLKISAVTSGEFDATKYKVVEKGIELKKIVVPKQGDVLFSRANTRELVGACCIVDKDYFDLFLPDKLWKIELDSKLVNSIYFKHIISSKGIRNEISKNATGTSGSMLNISMKKFQSILIPVPPIEIQNEFSIISNKVSQEKQKMKRSLAKLESSFQALLQQTFKWELKVNTEMMS